MSDLRHRPFDISPFSLKNLFCFQSRSHRHQIRRQVVGRSVKSSASKVPDSALSRPLIRYNTILCNLLCKLSVIPYPSWLGSVSDFAHVSPSWLNSFPRPYSRSSPYITTEVFVDFPSRLVNQNIFNITHFAICRIHSTDLAFLPPDLGKSGSTTTRPTFPV